MKIADFPKQLLPYTYITLALWQFYKIVMWLKKKKDKLKHHPVWFLLGYILAVVFALCDGVYNITLGTIIFRQLPAEFYFTSRLKRNKANPGWRGELATFICEQMLDPYDPSGDHC